MMALLNTLIDRNQLDDFVRRRLDDRAHEAPYRAVADVPQDEQRFLLIRGKNSAIPLNSLDPRANYRGVSSEALPVESMLTMPSITEPIRSAEDAAFERYAQEQGFDAKAAYKEIGRARRLARLTPDLELTDDMIAAFVDAG